MINNYVYYQKRKNQNLFKSLENPDTLFLSYTQNYIPIYKRFFDLNENNFNNINLNHLWYLHQISKEKKGENILDCIIKNKDSNVTKVTPVFFKLAPLLDPFKFLVGKYSSSNNIFSLPSLVSDECTIHEKILDKNNSAYVDGFFLFLTSKLFHHFAFIHGIDYYGSFLSIKNNYKINIFDDLEYLVHSEYFNKNKNKLFMVDDFDHLFSVEKTKLKPIKIEYTSSLKSNLSISSLPKDEYENIFKKENFFNDSSLDEIHSFIIEDYENGKTTSLKSSSSGSSCSSRTSRTSSSKEEETSNNFEDTLYDSEDETKQISNTNNLNDKEGDEGEEEEEREEGEEGDWEDELENELESEVEEIIEATISQFPVQVICMECCEYTLDELILSYKLSKEEWFSALMQIIMILITYQKMFGFTHNDLHTNNIMFNETQKKFIYYKYKNITYKVPTFGRIFKIIDFGRSIYKLNGQVFCSDSFQVGGDAATQYNTEPYFNKNKPRIEPNFSFDLCRLACSIYDYIMEDPVLNSKDRDLDSVKKIILEWCLDDKGINMLYKNNGQDRYPEFKLYKMIARHVHNHIPSEQLKRPEFKNFEYKIKKEDKVGKDEKINIDEFPILI